MVFDSRTDAGLQLAGKLTHYAPQNPIVFALPRGGVPVAYEIAKQLNAPLDVLIVRKLVSSRMLEIGLGAIAPGKTQIINEDLISKFKISEKELQEIITFEEIELSRKSLKYRSRKGMPDLESRTVVIVDDGVATGATIRVAIKYVKSFDPKKIVVATPVCASDTLKILKIEVDEVVCLNEIDEKAFNSVAEWYSDFLQVSDQEVLDILKKSQTL